MDINTCKTQNTSEIKTNPENIIGKGSAIFLHCSIKKPTSGCIAINKKYMKILLNKLKEGTIICIEPPKS